MDLYLNSTSKKSPVFFYLLVGSLKNSNLRRCSVSQPLSWNVIQLAIAERDRNFEIRCSKLGSQTVEARRDASVSARLARREEARTALLLGWISVVSDLPRVDDDLGPRAAVDLPEIIPSRLPECADTRSLLPRIISSGAESPSCDRRNSRASSFSLL